MDVTLLCSDSSHPVFPHLRRWTERRSDIRASLVTRGEDAHSGDLLVLVSCTALIPREVRDRYRHTLVLHASDLPRGRGWSPHIWSIIQGENGFVVSLLEASDRVDRGRLWAQRGVELRGDELYDEINERLFEAELDLIDFAVREADTVVPREQAEEDATYRRRRTPEDSHIDPDRSLREQFDLLRVCDPQRFPAFFELRGHRYEIVLRKRDR